MTSIDLRRLELQRADERVIAAHEKEMRLTHEREQATLDVVTALELRQLARDALKKAVDDFAAGVR